MRIDIPRIYTYSFPQSVKYHHISQKVYSLQKNLYLNDHTHRVRRTAVVMVGKSKRLPGKHFLNVIENKRLIDVVIENLKNLNFKVIVYSKCDISVDAEVIKDKSPWILPSFLNLFEILDENAFIFGGDMPFIKREAVKIIEKHIEPDFSVVPQWERTGFLEPLHAYYDTSIKPCIKEELELSNKPSLTGAIRRCRFVKYISAESMPQESFFNVNTFEDFEKFRQAFIHRKSHKFI